MGETQVSYHTTNNHHLVSVHDDDDDTDFDDYDGDVAIMMITQVTSLYNDMYIWYMGKVMVSKFVTKWREWRNGLLHFANDNKSVHGQEGKAYDDSDELYRLASDLSSR